MRGTAAPALCLAALAVAFTNAAPARGDAAGANAASRTVVVLRPASSDGITAEATARVRGELVAAGFDVAVVARGDEDAKRDLETAGRDLNAIAAFAIIVTPGDGGGALAEIWVSDRTRRKTVIEHAQLGAADHARGAEILAVRSVELLRASLAEFWLPSVAPPSPAPATPAPGAPPPPDRVEAAAPQPRGFPAGLRAGAGVGLLESFGQLGTAWAPMITVGYGWPSGAGARVSAVGLGPGADVSNSSGDARVDQQIVVLEALKAWWPASPIVPVVFAGVGGQHLRVVGTPGAAGGRGNTSDVWSMLASAGVGASVPLVWTVSFVAQARGFAAWPQSVIQIGGVDAGRSGTPSLLVDAGLSGVLP